MLGKHKNIFKVSRVRKMIESGARPMGGVVSDFGPEGKRYIQAMIFD